jgi:DNA-binding transcriptional LysR family regulator
LLTRITLRQLEYFVAAADCGRIAEAADRIHVSSPSISAAITHVETELGSQLFVRHHAQGLSLTAAGRDVLREAKRVLDQVAGLYTAASEAESLVRGPISVGCFVTLAPMLLPALCRGFLSAHTAVRLSQTVGNQEVLLDGLRRAEIDVALTYDLQVAGPDIAFEPLAAMHPAAILAEDHPLAQQSQVTLEELAPLPMVLLDLPLSREYFMALFHSVSVVPQVAVQSASLEVVRAMVANGFGYSLTNVRPVADVSLDGRRVVRVPLAGRHRPMWLGLASVKSRRMSRTVEVFAECCRAHISDAGVPGMVTTPAA